MSSEISGKFSKFYIIKAIKIYSIRVGDQSFSETNLQKLSRKNLEEIIVQKNINIEQEFAMKEDAIRNAKQQINEKMKKISNLEFEVTKESQMMKEMLKKLKEMLR